MSNNFKLRLQNSHTLVGSLVTLSTSEVAEMLSHVGFDWLWIEMEHAPLDLVVVQQMLQAIGERCPCLVRAPWNDSVWIKRILDLGCDGIIIPQIRTAKEAEAAVRACKYPPDGIRSVGIARAQKYGMQLQQYLTTANNDVTVVLQMQDIEAVENADEILAVPGIDAVIIGPYDLSGSMGLIGQVAHDEVQHAIRMLRESCVRHGVPVGMFATDAAMAREQIVAGCRMIALGTDSIHMWRSARHALDSLRENDDAEAMLELK